MFKILRHYGVPEKIVRAIMTIYKNSRSRVLLNDKQSKEFEITTGVLQGDTLAPFLFIICIDYVLKRAEQQLPKAGFTTQPRKSSREPEGKLFDFDFTDDIALLSDTFGNAQAQFINLK